MKKINLSEISKEDYSLLIKRPEINFSETIKTVQPILDDIKANGFKAVLNYAEKFDGLNDGNIIVKETEMLEASGKVESGLKEAIQTSLKNIIKFHKEQIPTDYEIETMKGVKCGRAYRPIEDVGLYIPGGTAPLFSTLLMLAVPAQIAGCKRIVVCSPASNGKLSNELLYTANILGITEFYKIGGAQAIGLMAYGVDKIKKVDKIFGPGNQYVTAAKSLISIDPDGCSIDMPAGPSEVLVIADETANPKFAAADLLSQAEHGTDSQVILISTYDDFLNKIDFEIAEQLSQLPRKEIARKALKNSLLIKSNTIEEAIEFSNDYAPEHLILQIKDSKKYLPKIQNAGSVFLGNYSPESVGDYASGTNHSLPTYGYAKTYSGVNLLSFMKGITYQEISQEGLQSLGKTVMDLANAEGLKAHSNAVEVRLNG
jgi:histidinol dehydrogenase